MQRATSCRWLVRSLVVCLLLAGCTEEIQEQEEASTLELKETSLIVLGTVQDAGSPHIGCEKACCKNISEKRYVVSLGLVDYDEQKSYLLEATPDLTEQLKLLARYAPFENRKTSDGVFLTHAHIGHYTGLMYFGKEALGARNVPVYAMPRMREFLQNDGPWSQLVNKGNIALQPLTSDSSVIMSDHLQVTPFRVPHRDEYSETVGYRIDGPNRSLLFIPDIDKWEKWNLHLEDLLHDVDIAYVDGTFFHGDELGHRDISQIPHPFVIESMERFSSLPSEERAKIHFIHFNHTNPLLNEESEASKLVKEYGFGIARLGDVLSL